MSSFFDPLPPKQAPEPDREEVLAERILLAVGELKSALAQLPAPQVHVAAPDLADIVTAVTSLKPSVTAEEIATAIAGKLRIPEPREPDLSVLGQVATALEKLDFRMKGAQPAFGASGPSNIASDPNREVGRVTVKNPTDVSAMATQTTLAAVLAELEKRPTYKVANALTNVSSGGSFTTVAEVTPTVATTVEGYGTDLNGLSAVTFRYRLITGTDAEPTIIDMEQISAGSNSWRPVKYSAAANTRLAVQVAHGETLAQDFRATVNYREGP